MDLIAFFSDWIKKVERENPPGDNITAINFGMMLSDKGYMVYITGAELYDKDDDDWAGEIDYQPIRANKYLLLPREVTKGLKWKNVLELVISTLSQLAAADAARLLFKNRVVTAGFDDSELTVVKSK